MITLGRRRQGDGLRHRPRHRRHGRHDDPDPVGRRHGAVPLARAGPGPDGRRAVRPLLDRLPPVRAARRPAALRRRLRGRDRLPARRRAAPAAERLQRRRRRRPRRRHPARPREGPRGAATRTPPPSGSTSRTSGSAARSARPPWRTGPPSAPPPPRPSRRRMPSPAPRPRCSPRHRASATRHRGLPPSATTSGRRRQRQGQAALIAVLVTARARPRRLGWRRRGSATRPRTVVSVSVPTIAGMNEDDARSAPCDREPPGPEVDGGQHRP